MSKKPNKAERLEADLQVSRKNEEALRIQLEGSRVQLQEARATVRALRINQHTEEQIRAEIFGLTATSPNPPKWVTDLPPGNSFGVPMTLWSDWHAGEVVSPHEVGGTNTFSTEILVARAKRLVDTIIDVCFSQMAKPNYPGIVVALGGDMVSGDIHDELSATNDRYMMQTVHDLFDVLIAALTKLADRFGNVYVPCVPGNHGRSTQKPRAKGRAYTSYEWLLYNMLEKWFKGDPRVKFYIPPECDAHFTVVGHRFLLTHGDALGVKGGDGIIGSLGPIMRGKIKIGNAESAIGRSFDTILMGHWHQYITLQGVIVNGSLKGFDEYARLLLRAPFQLPIQALWFCHAKRGITNHIPIYLEDPLENPSEDGWVKWNPTDDIK